MADHQLASRIVWSVGLTIIRAGLNFTTGLLLARLLGAEDFGRYAFIIATFIAVRQLFDLATSNAFFTFISEKTRSRRFLTYYFGFVAAQILISLLLLLVLIPQAWLDRIWLGETRSLLALGFLAVYVQHAIWKTASQLGEAARKSRWIQSVNTLVVVTHLIAVLLLAYLGTLGLVVLFIITIFEWIFGSLAIARLYKTTEADQQAQDEPLGAIFAAYRSYCAPLIILNLFIFAFAFLDRWMLQNWAGSVQQSYFAIGLQFSSAALLATTSVLQIFWKEFSASSSQTEQALLYRRASRAVFVLSVATAAGISPWIGVLVPELLGPNYSSGTLAIALLVFIPTSQSLGQVTGTLVLATKRTKLTSQVGIFSAILSIIGAYIALAPSTSILPGFSGGASGLAIKHLAVGFFSVNLLIWLLRRDFGIPLKPSIQLTTILATTGVSWAVANSLQHVSQTVGVPLVFAFFMHGVITIAALALILLRKPSLIGIPDDIQIPGLRRFR